MAGTWSCTGAAPGCHPTEDLFQIIRRARIYAPLMYEALVIDDAVTCALTHLPNESGNAQTHCDYVLTARAYANAGQWSKCIAALKHMGVVNPGPVALPATAWPCDTGTGVGDADVHLFTVIQLANFGAGPKRDAVIDRATTCALTHDAETGTGYANGTAHVDWVEKAQGHAEAGDWDLCIEALDHSGGGTTGAGGGGGGGAGADAEAELDALLKKIRAALKRWLERFGG